METVLKQTANFSSPLLSKRGMPTVMTFLWAWLMVWVAVIFRRWRMTSAVTQGEKEAPHAPGIGFHHPL